ncbi:MAG TPA: ABC transporter ATP-binding protein [Anaerolineales bacterium]
MKPLLRLRAFWRPYIPQILLSLFFLIILTGLNLAIPAIIRQVIDVGLAHGDIRLLINSALIILGIGAVRATSLYFQRFLNEWISQKVAYDLRNLLYDHIQHLPFTFHDHAQTGQLISRCIEDVRSIQTFTGQGLVEMVRMILLMAGILVILFTQNASLAAVSLLPLIPLILITTDFGRRSTGLFLAVDNALGELSVRLQENAVGAQVVRAFAREPYEIGRFDQANRLLYDARVNVNREWSKIISSSNLLVTLGTILILWFGGQMVLKGQMTIGEVVAFNSYLLMLANPVQQLTWVVNAAGEAAAGVQRSFEILDMQPEIQSPPGAELLPALSGKVVFRDVHFNYQGETARALEDIRLEVKPNQIVALIGPTGSGKTSLVNLIPRFYDVSDGAIQVDDRDVRQVDLVSLRRQIGIVLQTSLLFSTTVRENIAYGRTGASEEEILAAAQAAQAHEFILELPNGYDTIVGERGVTLSGGQRQRVAIARAVLMDPRILILDDSTSSVDTETERLIQRALDQLMEGRTTFVIAHRLSTVRRADLIVVMDAGRIVERGTHSELLAQNGLYREIYELQLRDQEQFHEDMDALEGSNRGKTPAFTQPANDSYDETRK